MYGKSATVDGAASSYVYDGDGKRASKTVGGATTSYVYDVNASLPVLLDDGARKYVWGLGLAFAVDSSSNVTVYHTDGLGSVRALTDGLGNIVQSYRYDEYGVATSSQGSIDQPFRYTGEQHDSETGLVYLRARSYDPGMGRFVTRDSWPGTTGVPETINRYSYVANNPVPATDPSGLMMTVPCKARSGGILKDGAATAGGLGLNPLTWLVTCLRCCLVPLTVRRASPFLQGLPHLRPSKR